MNLISIFGKENVSKECIDLLSYSTDASMVFGNAEAVVWPTDSDQIRRLMILASNEEFNVVPRGAGTGLAGAVVPKDSIVVDFSKMNRIIEVSVSGNYCIVEPGVVIDQLNSILAPGLYFPIIPSSSRICQVGGVLSANAAGVRAVKYGKAMDWVEEMDIIDGTGKLLAIRGEKLSDFVGREGTTGIIVKAKLKLAKPLADTTVSLFEADNAEDIISKAKEIKKNKALVGLEFTNKITSELMGLEPKNLIFAEFEDGSGEIKNIEEIKKIWEKREGAYPAIASKGYIIIEDPKVSVDKIHDLLAWLNNNNVPCFGHIGFGIVHPVFKYDEKEKINEMFGVVKKLNGSVTGEHGYGLTKKKFVPESVKEEFIKLKKKYDPNNILNKGKVV